MTETAPTTDNLRTAARRLLAGGEWITLAAAVEALEAKVDPDKAAKCYDRLERAGKAALTDPSERQSFGVRRLVMEAMNHLASGGQAEATGTGDERKWRLIPKERAVFSRPKPKRDFLPLEKLTFEADLQNRSGDIHDEKTVKKYQGVLEDGGELPEIECVFDEKKYWVFDGFQRGEAYTREGKGSVPVLVYLGTYEDAEFYALSSNARHGLTRSDADVRKALNKLLDTPHLLKRVTDSVAKHNDLSRAIGAAAGVSKGLVYKVLRERGVKVEGAKLVHLPLPSPASRTETTVTTTTVETPAAKTEPKGWLDTPVEELDLSSAVLHKLEKAGVTTLGELADDLKAGETYGLANGVLLKLKAVVDPNDESDEPEAAPKRYDDHPPLPPEPPPVLTAYQIAQQACDRGPEFLAVARLGRQFMTAASHLIRSPAGEHIRRVCDGKLVVETQVKKHGGNGTRVESIWVNESMVKFIHALVALRPGPPCAGCAGKGNRCCHGVGFAVADKSYRVNSGTAKDLFDELPEGEA